MRINQIVKILLAVSAFVLLNIAQSLIQDYSDPYYKKGILGSLYLGTMSLAILMYQIGASSNTGDIWFLKDLEKLPVGYSLEVVSYYKRNMWIAKIFNKKGFLKKHIFLSASSIPTEYLCKGAIFTIGRKGPVKVEDD